MRAVSRGSKPAPAGLNKLDKNKKTELDRVRAHLNAVLPPDTERTTFKFSAYKESDVKLRLEQIFYKKCAYCESFYGAQAPVDVEHYRPKGRVEGDPDHQGYWWLASEWTNLLPSCLDCNRRRKQMSPVISGNLEVLYKHTQTGKKDCFPIEGDRALTEGSEILNEGALLLDPTRDNPNDHLVYWLKDDCAAGLVFPAALATGSTISPVAPLVHTDPTLVAQHAETEGVSIKGAVSIQVYGLNRVHLVQERAKILQQLRFLESVLIKIGTVSQELEGLNEDLNRAELADAVKSLDALQTKILEQMRHFSLPQAPHSAIATAFLEDFKSRLSIA
ncbi:endonuclease [Pseudomonas viridiflava]|uniref:HNH endonuclease n=1 Tax=Pseudomonas viridiflava TaxID=33069 RepID=UPI002A6B3A48|nr:endonuclease [Pseudomonas viridiflava]MDY0936611.1 endonuclease [Pseudomonas viridiflava]MDY1012087.1 endonuclease [Pseudomonas viridiflava]